MSERKQVVEAVLGAPVVGGGTVALSFQIALLWGSFALAVTGDWTKAVSAVFGSAALLSTAILLFALLARTFAALPEEKTYYVGGDEIVLGDEIRETDDGRRLRELGYSVPAMHVNGINAWGRFAANVIESGRMNREAGLSFLPDNEDSREWIKGMQTLWCMTGMARAARGWNGDDPDLSGGIAEIHEAGWVALRMARDERGRESVCAWLRAHIEQEWERGTPPTLRNRLTRSLASTSGPTSAPSAESAGVGG